MPALPNCPKCNSEYTYEDRHLLVCPMCAHEWTLETQANPEVDVSIKMPMEIL